MIVQSYNSVGAFPQKETLAEFYIEAFALFISLCLFKIYTLCIEFMF